jgi:hypothetical protein
MSPDLFNSTPERDQRRHHGDPTAVIGLVHPSVAAAILRQGLPFVMETLFLSRRGSRARLTAG